MLELLAPLELRARWDLLVLLELLALLELGARWDLLVLLELLAPLELGARWDLLVLLELLALLDLKARLEQLDLPERRVIPGPQDRRVKWVLLELRVHRVSKASPGNRASRATLGWLAGT